MLFFRDNLPNYQHYVTDHDILPPKFDQISSFFEILYSHPEIINVKIAETIHIKTSNPYINVKYNEFYDFAKLF